MRASSFKYLLFCIITNLQNKSLTVFNLYRGLVPKELLTCFIFMVFLFPFSINSLSQINVAFTSDVLQGCSPVSAAFTNQSTPVNGSTYSWDFGNGNVSTAQNPQTSYLNPGSYTVKLTVTNGGISETLIKENYIVVHSKPLVQFNLIGDTIGCSPFLVSFNNQTTDPENSELTFEWSFGDGAKSTEQNPTHDYYTAGNFDVTIVATNAHGCNASFTQSQLVHVLKPKASFGVDETYSCSGTLTTTFTNVSEGQATFTSLWDFGDGVTSNQTSAIHQYANPGIYSIKLTITDEYGCADEITKSNLIQIVKTSAKFNLSKDTICPKQNLTLTNNSENAETYLWRLGDQTTSTATNVTKSFLNAGDYTIWLVAQKGNCMDSISKKINVEFVKADFLVNESFICELPKIIDYQDQSQQAVTYSWRFGNGSQSASKNPSVTYGTGIPLTNYKASFSDTLVVTSKHGCTDRFIKENSVQIHLPNVKMITGTSGNSTNLDVCIPANILFTDQSQYDTELDFITSRQWSYKSVPIGSELSTQINVNETGNLPVELTITTSKGCVHKKVEYISAGTSLTPNFVRVGNYEKCASDPVDFTITAPNSSLITNASWNFGDGATGMMLFPPHTFVKTGTMDVTLTVYNYGCASKITKPNIVKINGPIVSYNSTIDCDLPNNRVFNATIQDATNYTWSFGDESPDISNQNNISHTFPGRGEYPVILKATNSSSGCTFELRRDIFVRNISSEYQITDGAPCLNNALTIDGSASNDAIEYLSQENSGKYLWLVKEENKTFFTQGPLVHKFATKGLNHVSLIVQDINGCKDTLTKEFNIFRPEPNFEANYKVGCMPVTFEFTDLTSSEAPITNWLWNFGNGSTSTQQNPTFDYTSYGGYNISLEVTDNIGCTAKLTKSQLVKAIFPDASFKASKTQFCLGDNTILSDTSPSNIVQYLWQLSDGRSSDLAEPDFTFDESGYYSVSLSIKDAHGCETTKNVDNFLHVQKYPIANFEADVTNSNCYPLVVQFKDKSENEFPGSWEWHFGENNNLSELKDPFFIYNRPGDHNVKLISRTTYGCSDTIIKPAFIHVGGPFATIGMPDTVCQKMDISFLAENLQNVHDIRWDFGDGYTGLGNGAVHKYMAPGTIFPVLFIRSDANNTCNKAVVDTLSILDLQALFAIKDNLDKGCVPFGPELINQSLNATSWIWDFGNGAVIDEETPQYQYPTSGDFNLRLIALHNLGCSDTSEIKRVTVFPLPIVKASKDTVICKDGSAYLSATGGVNYSWIPTEMLSAPNTSETTATPNETTLYLVSVTDENNCVNSHETLVSVQQIPTVAISDTTLNIGEFVSLDITDAGISSYTWSPNQYLSCINCPNPVFQPLETTAYQIAVTDTSNCFTISYPFIINILERYSVDVPTAFTPNGDGINDRIFVKGWGIKELVSFKIYNRLGQELYSSSILIEGWDGTYKGKMQPIETYSYQVQVRTFDENVRTKSGTLKLLR